jgi:hypothetical protein
MMKADTYLLLTDSQSSSDIIYSRNSSLKVRVHSMQFEDFIPNEDEIQLYGYLEGTLLAFETVEIAADNALDVLSAIKWYTRYKGVPDMEILPEDPRYDHEMAV